MFKNFWSNQMFERHEGPTDSRNIGAEKRCEDSARSAAISLANGFQKLLEEADEDIVRQVDAKLASLQSQLAEILACQQATSGHVQARLADFSTELRQAATKQQQLAYSLQTIEKQLEALILQNRLLENASKENRLLTQDHYQQCIVEPMARSLFAVFDDIEGARRRCGETEQIDSSAVCGTLDGIYIHLRQFLSIYQIEPIRHSPNSRFDPKVMRPIKVIATENKDLNNCVAVSLQAGFRWREDRLLRPESVAVYRYEKPLNNNFDKEERS
jgi:molecular chaperone GrpE (heat shock protein)